MSGLPRELSHDRMEQLGHTCGRSQVRFPPPRSCSFDPRLIPVTSPADVGLPRRSRRHFVRTGTRLVSPWLAALNRDGSMETS
jgi:hypothetical protein